MNGESFKQWCEAKASETGDSVKPKKPLLMAVLNCTPDSFSDGGRYLNPDAAYDRAMRCIEEGADLIDIGGESSRPGALPVSYEEELTRVIPLIERIRAHSEVCISIDTHKFQVMEAAVGAGASVINDIMALRGPYALETAARLRVPVCLMHMQGLPQSMQHNPNYEEVVYEVNAFFQSRIEACLYAGIPRGYLILDPGFGFGKSARDNMMLVNQIHQFHKHRQPLLLGASRKSTIGHILRQSVSKRVIGGLAVHLFAVLQGVSIIRTHDVEETRQAFEVLEAILEADEVPVEVQEEG